MGLLGRLQIAPCEVHPGIHYALEADGFRSHTTKSSFLSWPSAAQVISCTAEGNDLRFDNGLAKVICPNNCQLDPESVALGASIHPVSSSVCSAAVVDRVMPTFGGEILVSRAVGLPSYSGRNEGFAASLPVTGDRSDAFHAYAVDNINLAPTIPKEEKLTCRATFAMLGHDMVVGSSKMVNCPPDCEKEGELYGTNIFTPGSSVCRAAQHAHVLGTKGGRAVVTLGHGQDQFFGSYSGGDKSEDAPEAQQGYTVALPIPDIMNRVRAQGVEFL